MTLPDWIPGVKAHREHARAWAEELSLDAEGRSLFSKVTEAAVLAQLYVLGVELETRKVHTRTSAQGTESFIELKTGGSRVVVWVYNDQIDVVSGGYQLRLEHWDTETPSAAREAASAALAGAVSGATATDT